MTEQPGWTLLVQLVELALKIGSLLVFDRYQIVNLTEIRRKVEVVEELDPLLLLQTWS